VELNQSEDLNLHVQALISKRLGHTLHGTVLAFDNTARRPHYKMSTEKKTYVDEHHGFGTTAIHAGQEPDPHTGAVAVPISLASTFAQVSPGVVYGKDQANSFGNGWEYSRTGNPTRGAFERAIASCEQGKHAVAYSSGMAATTAVVHLLKQGDHVISIDDVYGGTQRYFRRTVNPTYGIEFDFVDMSTPSNIENFIRPTTKMVWLESPTNPTLKITDIAAVAEVTKKHNLILVVDNTFMSPYFQNPLTLGANVVIHSITKYINGHSDVVMGVVITNDTEINTKLRFIQNGIGAVPSPFDSYMALRGLKTLHVRMAAHAKNAQAVAEFLESHPQVEKVIYPGLPSHPQHAIAKKQAKGFGGMITFYIKGGIEKARAFLETVEIFTLAESLGAVESLAESPAIMTHASVPKEHRELLGISDNLIRLSVGIEGLPDIIADLQKALAAEPKKN
jgi:cystathionine gamma-lyase